MKDVELKLTTASALAFEEATGKGLLESLGEIVQSIQSGVYPKLSLIVNLFCVMGKDYTVEMFEAWEIPLVEKINKIADAAKEFVVGKNAKPVSANSSVSATHTVSNRKK